MQSRGTQITMVKWTNAGGQTKRANERSFVYRPPAWRRWRNVKTTYIHKLVYRVKRFNKSQNPRRNWTDCQVKPKLISYILMKSLTFFSLSAARASQVYTKTVNSGFFSALLALYKATQRPNTVVNFILKHILMLSFTITRFLNHFKQNIFHTFYS